MTDAGLSEEEVAFRDSVRAFVDRRIVPNATRWDLEERYPRELFQETAALGWLGIGFPEEVGGSGGGSVLYAILCAELARGSAAIALGLYVHTALAASAILHLGSAEQKARYLPEALAGKRIGCWGYAEPGAGADIACVRTRARCAGEHYVIDGAKLYITNSPFADFMVIVAQTDPARGLKGMSIFVVDRDTPGVRVSAPFRKLGMGASEMAEIVFEGVRVPAGNRLGTEHLGFIEALQVLTLGRVASAGFGVGLGRAALGEALRYASTRMQGDVPITCHQFVRFTLADMATRIEAAWRLALHAARLVEAGGDYDCAASMAKLFATETCSHVCERALHLCGAQGYMRESAAQRFYRDCKVLEIGEGTSEIQRETIFRHLSRQAGKWV
ncbi:MAG: acyl-CoA dehydrogenase family protein [Burkholderiaceae bacterium]|nr:acyl-CoA dehydrogenase family protein [Burkholderiaceae bacterium]MEB2351646.1 acyl-CoA dehydrogenase family protein [Burkholderiaceae bacterium]